MAFRLENKSQEGLGAKEKARRKTCKVRFSIIKKNKCHSRKNYMKAGVKKLLRAGMVPARTWGAHAVGMAPTVEVSIETTDGSCGRHKEYDFLVLVHGNLWPGSGRRAFHNGHSVLGRMSFGLT